MLKFGILCVSGIRKVKPPLPLQQQPDQFLVLQTLILASTLEKMPWNSVVKKGLRTYDTHNKAVWHKSICQMSLDKWISQVLSKVISTSFDQEDHLKDLVTLHSLDFTPYF